MSPEFTEQSSFVLTTKLVLPNPDDLPAVFAEGAIYAAVAGLVAGELGGPERRPCLRPGGMPGAACLGVATAMTGRARLVSHRLGEG